ncbi:unnamed protein product [Malus baccata var. baccata]
MLFHHEAFLELTGFEFLRNSEVKNKTVRAWSGPKADNIVLRRSRARGVVELGSGCDNLVLEPIPGQKCADEDVGPLRGMDLDLVSCIFTSLPSTRHFGSSLVSDSIGTPKLSEFSREQSQDG